MPQDPIELEIEHVENSWFDATGDVCQGDVIRFEEAVWSQSYSRYGKKSPPAGQRIVEALIVDDSYGDDGQHTFSLWVLNSSGYEALEYGAAVRRKGRNVYRNRTQRLRWVNEDERQMFLDDKHDRGTEARRNRGFR